jgi:HNH endonuclease
MNVEGFWSRVEIIELQDGCWLWRGAVIPQGYGMVRWDGKTRRAHQIAYFLRYGYWPGYLMHRCDTPRCVRPDHLIDADHRANMADMVSKGRSTMGERNPQYRLTEADVRIVRDRLERGESSYAIAKDYGVARTTIAAIKVRRSWRHI